VRDFFRSPLTGKTTAAKPYIDEYESGAQPLHITQSERAAVYKTLFARWLESAGWLPRLDLKTLVHEDRWGTGS
jgi:hypothetical protein